MSGIDGLNADDPGIALLTDAVRSVPADEILLVHCGDLPGVGAGAQRLVLDVRERIDSVATPIDERLDAPPVPRPARHALVWPRAHLGKDFTRWCLARAVTSVVPGGLVWCAVRKSKGAASVADAMRELVGPVDVVARDKGYRLLRAERGRDRTEAWRAVLQARYRIEDPRLPGLSLASAPGVFSRQALDDGTAALIDDANATLEETPQQVVDLGCGVGPLALYAARRWTSCRVTAVDTNLLAVALATENARAHDVADRVTVIASDGLPARPAPDVDLALVNPPTHADPATLHTLVASLVGQCRDGARALFVVSRSGRLQQVLDDLGVQHRCRDRARYTVVEAHVSRR